jgi:rhamnogalacturonan endolyase
MSCISTRSCPHSISVAMGLFQLLGVAALAGCAAAAPAEARAAKPKSFLQDLGNSTWVIGNGIWNMTQGRQYGVKLWYKGKDRVGPTATGHYVSYSK